MMMMLLTYYNLENKNLVGCENNNNYHRGVTTTPHQQQQHGRGECLLVTG